MVYIVCPRCADNSVVRCVFPYKTEQFPQIDAKRNGTEHTMSSSWRLMILLLAVATSSSLVFGFSIQYRGNTQHPSRKTHRTHYHGSISFIYVLYSHSSAGTLLLWGAGSSCAGQWDYLSGESCGFMCTDLLSRGLCAHAQAVGICIYSFLISALYVFLFQLRSHGLGHWLLLYAQRLFPAPSVLLCGAHLFQLSDLYI